MISLNTLCLSGDQEKIHIIHFILCTKIFLAILFLKGSLPEIVFFTSEVNPQLTSADNS